MLSEIRDQLLGEHADLRAQIEGVRAVMDRWKDGAASQSDARGHLAVLANALRTHNLREEKALGGLVRAADAWGGVRAEIMSEEHFHEHADLFVALSSTVVAVEPSAWRGLVDRLLAHVLDHLAREERAFLNEDVLCDDSVVTGYAGG
jgi:Hemerythrin HHE cation binding domain